MEGPALGKSWMSPTESPLCPFHCLIHWGKLASRPHKEKGGGSSFVMKENVGPRWSSNMWNMNIPCYFIIGKPNHQEEAGLDVSTVCSLFLLEKKVGRDRHLFSCSTSAKRLWHTANIAVTESQAHCHIRLYLLTERACFPSPGMSIKENDCSRVG